VSKASPILGTFNSGELSPMLDGRIDFNKYASGASILENFIPTVQGPNVRRGGTRFVGEVKDSSEKVYLYPFEFSVEQAYMLEFGHLYCRFYTWDAVTKVRGILESSPGVPVEVVTPYTTADLFNTDGTPKLGIEQSGDFLYIAHGSYRQRIIKRTSATSFTIENYESKGGPWMPLNETDTAVYASAESGTGIDLVATGSIFTAGVVGALFYLESRDVNSIPAWEVNKAVVVGDRRRSDGKTYSCTDPGTTGTNRPVHTQGALYDGDAASARWLYRDPGYGYVRITSLTATAAVTRTITGAVDNGSGRVRITSAAHGFANGDPVTVAGVTGTTEANGTWFISNVTANTFDLLGTTFANAYVAGGTASSVASSRAKADVIERIPSECVGSLKATTRWAHGEWSTANGWPTDVAFFRERLWWGRKQFVWGSVSSDFSDFSPKNYGQVTADMAVTVTLVSGKINDIQWMSGDEELLCGTAGGEFSIGELTNGDPLGPGNVRAKLISSYGSRAIQPIKNGDATLFIQRAGLKARDVSYDTLSYQYKGSDATVLAEHITASGVVNIAFAQEPDPIVWGIRADGKLIGFTWNNEQEVRGWHRQPIGGNGIVESLAVMPAAEGDRSELWLVVRRTINGVTKRYIEYMERPWRLGDSQASSFYVDCGLTYNGAPSATLSGLGHLEGMAVDILADGAPHPQRVVTGGAVTLQRPASVVNIGLPCPCRYRSMRVEAGAADGTAQGKTKRIHKAVLRFLNTGGGKYGSRSDNMDPLYFRKASDPMGAPVPLFSGDKVVTWPEGYNGDGYLMYENDQPTPATLVAIMPQIVVQDSR
jgi:hypothetical protein